MCGIRHLSVHWNWKFSWTSVHIVAEANIFSHDERSIYIYISASYICLHQETYLHHAVTYVCLYEIMHCEYKWHERERLFFIKQAANFIHIVIHNNAPCIIIKLG